MSIYHEKRAYIVCRRKRDAVVVVSVGIRGVGGHYQGHDLAFGERLQNTLL